MYTLDTNIIIYYSNGEAPILAFLREQTAQGAPLFVSAVTEHAHSERLSPVSVLDNPPFCSIARQTPISGRGFIS